MLNLNEIYLGDCLELMKNIPDKSIDMILCDLPYGTTQCKWDVIIPFEYLWDQYKRIIKDEGTIVLTSQQPFATDLINSARDLFRYEIIWEKTMKMGFFNANKMPLRAHENILIFYKSLPTYNPIKSQIKEKYRKRKREKDRYTGYSSIGECNDFYENKGERFPTSIIKFSNWNGALFGDNTKATKHPTQKPVALFEYLIKTYTNEGDLVLDNCIGSGTTAIACINTGRNFIGIEKDFEYYSKGKERINKSKQQERLLNWF
jgi:site-specific DNA-methyltransferase (adenine-specific)